MHPCAAVSPGGPGGFHTRVFKVVSRDYSDRSSAVNLTYTSADGEEGYPGTLELTVRYELLAHSPELQMTFSATTDKATPGKTHTLLVTPLVTPSSYSSL